MLYGEGQTLTVFGTGGVTRPVQRYRAELVWRPSGRRCPPGALLATIEAQRNGNLQLPFDANGLLPHLLAVASSSEEAARLFATDALELERPDLVEYLPLAHGERQLLYAWYEVQQGTDAPHTLDRLLSAWGSIPEPKARTLLPLWRHVDSRRGAVLDALSGCDADDVLAATLRAEIEGRDLDPAATLQVLRDLVRFAGGGVSLADVKRLHRLLEVQSEEAVRATTDPPDWIKGKPGHVEWLALQTRAGGGPGAVGSLERSEFSRIPGAIIEDLVAQGALRPDQVRNPDLRDLCRAHLDPLAVPAARLLELGQADLLCWAAIMAKNPSAVGGIEPAPLGRARLLATLAAGDPGVDDDDLATLDSGERALAESLVACLRKGSWSEASPLLLGDESVAPVLAGLEPPGEIPAAPGTLVATERLKAAKRLLHDWKWADAEAESRAALAAAPLERQRDEALNLLAASQWQRGQITKALAAIDKALEGSYTDALLINAGVVAGELDPAIAVEHFARLAKEAPSTAERASAAERSVVFWRTDGKPWGDAGPHMPTELRHALRELVARDDLDLSRWLSLVALLAERDSEWLASAPTDALGVRGSSPAGRVVQGRAAGAEEWIAAMASALRGPLDDETRVWLVGERDRLVQAVITELLQERADLAAADLALEIVDQDLPVDDDDGIALRALAAWVASKQIDTDTEEPSELLIKRTEEALRDLESPRLSSERREVLRPVVEAAGDAVARSLFVARAKAFEGVIDSYSSLIDELRTLATWDINKNAVRDVLAGYEAYCTESGARLRRVSAFVEDVELAEAMSSLAREMSEALASIRATRSQL